MKLLSPVAPARDRVGHRPRPAGRAAKRGRPLLRCYALRVADTAKGTFPISMIPALGEVGGHVERFDFTKVFKGDLEANGTWVMLSCGDPNSGSAGYVAIESVDGRLGDRSGGFALSQLGMLHHGSQTLHYELVPGLGLGGLQGITGTFHLAVDADGTHRYALEYQLPG